MKSVIPRVILVRVAYLVYLNLVKPVGLFLSRHARHVVDTLASVAQAGRQTAHLQVLHTGKGLG